MGFWKYIPQYKKTIIVKNAEKQKIFPVKRKRIGKFCNKALLVLGCLSIHFIGKNTPADSAGVFAFLSLATHEEQSQSAGAGVRADDRAYVIDKDLLDAVLFLQDLLQQLGILQAVTMADERNIVLAG